MDNLLDKELDSWITFNPNSIVFEQDEVPEEYQKLSQVRGGRTAKVMGPNGKPVQIIIPENIREKEQTAVGTGTVLKVMREKEIVQYLDNLNLYYKKNNMPERCLDDKEMADIIESLGLDPRLNLLSPGQRIKFCAGAQINSEFLDRPRIQIIHISNILSIGKSFLHLEK